MIRLLFVDDEPMLLNAIRTGTRRWRGEWSLRFAESGPAALAALEQEPADVVVSDHTMPHMKGAELLEQVRARYPQALRVLATGHVDSANVGDGLRVAHQVLTKPFPMAELHRAVSQLLELKVLFDNPLMHRLVHAVDRLPTPRAVFSQLGPLLADPDVELKAVGRVVGGDPALSLTVMKMANSAFFAMPKVSDATAAVQRLGLSLVKSAVTYAQLLSAVEPSLEGSGAHVDVLQRRSLAAASVALKLLPGEAGKQAYLAALLADVGGLVLLGAFPEHRAALFAGDPWPWARAERERQALGFTHAEAGGYLLGTWGLPPAVVEAVARQHRPAAAAGPVELGVVGAVHVAQRLSMEREAELGGRPERAEFDLAYLGACGQTLPGLVERAFGREAA